MGVTGLDIYSVAFSYYVNYFFLIFFPFFLFSFFVVRLPPQHDRVLEVEFMSFFQGMRVAKAVHSLVYSFFVPFALLGYSSLNKVTGLPYVDAGTPRAGDFVKTTPEFSFKGVLHIYMV